MSDRSRESRLIRREVASEAIATYIGRERTKEDVKRFRALMKDLFDKGMTNHDLDVVTQMLAKGKDADYQGKVQAVRRMFDV
ncbi:MAG: hypothetical protein LYZ66_02760 [Nitrososphaerales archaeon]|nr:hypothetical protein [Nitrososphaerales archaeon]